MFKLLCCLSSHFRYLEGAVVPDNDSLVGVLEPPTGRRRDYIPSANPGSRLPHIDVRVLSNSSSEVCIFLIRLYVIWLSSRDHLSYMIVSTADILAFCMLI